MIEKLKWKRIPGSLVIASALVFAGTFGTAITAAAQDFSDLQMPKGALVLKAQGSFFVGGELFDAPDCIEDVAEPDSDFCPIMADQMYVRYMIPEKGGGKNTPVVMIEGGGLTGKSYETTPDGRMGWDEHFVRKGHASYVVDVPHRGRSGFNPTTFLKVKAGDLPPDELPTIIGSSTNSPDRAWTSFAFGPAPGVPYDNIQFPVEAINELAKQGYPTMSIDPPTGFFPHNYEVLSELATKLGGAVLMGHSFSGWWPFRAALIDPTVVKGIIVIDGCPGSIGFPPLFPGQLESVAHIPILGVMGNREPENTRGGPETCQDFIDDFAAVGGNAQLIFPNVGNSHLMMMDKNNQEIADLILEWIDENVD